ncbi:hypothetical protein [Lamprobacter modestohalophilus]|uniref:hypothetical protein n=1 Tax=Lamprobacter modestohalophilus TaxID=1064514 RepID=UPI001908D7FF|nr:hypothetical protein [Lamprobacter modestohalophilus]
MNDENDKVTIWERSQVFNRVALGFVNRFGYGVQRAQALLQKNGNPPADYAFDDRTVLVKVHQAQS